MRSSIGYIRRLGENIVGLAVTMITLLVLNAMFLAPIAGLIRRFL